MLVGKPKIHEDRAFILYSYGKIFVQCTCQDTFNAREVMEQHLIKHFASGGLG
jgi:hypothetical protein